MSVDYDLLRTQLREQTEKRRARDTAVSRARKKANRKYSNLAIREARDAAKRLLERGWPDVPADRVERIPLLRRRKKSIRLMQLRGKPFVGDLSYRYLPREGKPYWLGEDGILYQVNFMLWITNDENMAPFVECSFPIDEAESLYNLLRQV